MKDIQKQIEELQKQVELLKKDQPKDKLSMIVFSGSLDKIIAAFIIATGAAAMGTEVTMFFTFWGTAALRKKVKIKKNFISRMFGFMLPTGFNKLKLSNMNMAGMGTAMMKNLMKKKGVPSLNEMLEIAEESDVKIFICEMSMDLMGMQPEEIVDYKHFEYCGVAKFLAEADESRSTLFI